MCSGHVVLVVGNVADGYSVIEVLDRPDGTACVVKDCGRREPVTEWWAGPWAARHALAWAEGLRRTYGADRVIDSTRPAIARRLGRGTACNRARIGFGSRLSIPIARGKRETYADGRVGAVPRGFQSLGHDRGEAGGWDYAVSVLTWPFVVRRGPTTAARSPRRGPLSLWEAHRLLCAREYLRAHQARWDWRAGGFGSQLIGDRPAFAVV